MSSTKRLMAVALLPVFFITGCGGSSSHAKTSASAPSSSSSAMASPVTNGNLSDIKVDATNASKPAVSIPANKLPFGTASVNPKVLKTGSGKTVGAKDLVHADFLLVNGTTGKTVFSTFGQVVPSLEMADPQTLPGLVSAMKGKQVGSTFVASLPPSQAFGAAGNSQLGIGANDNLVMYVDIESANTPLTQAQGKTQAAPAGMPLVSVPNGQGKLATITVPKGAKAPTKLETATLIEGTGATVKSGQTLAASYTGQIWGSKTAFDATASHGTGGTPSAFLIGKGAVISGWDKALVGQKVGSRVLIVVPPSEGYGTTGNAQAGIKGTDTLVFVVDILAAN